MKLVQKKEKIFLYLLMTLTVVQPILDLIWFNDGTVGEIFGFTIPTLVRMGMVAILGIMSFFVFKFNKSHLWLVLYLVAILIYFVFHHINAQNFNSLVPGNFGYSFLGECFYLLRMCIPIAIMYFIYNSKFSKKHFDICVVAVSLMMSLNVIFTNIFKVSIGSYSNEMISGNVFDWFLNPGVYVHRELASKGWFYWSIVSLILVLVLPYMCWLFIDTKKKLYCITVTLLGLALFMFGTKATSYSVIIIIFLMLCMYVFFSFIMKSLKFDLKIGLTLGILLIASVVMLKYSPNSVRMVFESQYQEDIDEEETEEMEDTEKEELESKEEIIEFFDEKHEHLSIAKKFIKESYPYEYDPEFWYDIYLNYAPSQRMQNRFIQQEMLERVKEINDDPLDTWFGLGYTRTANIFNLEKDFLYQYYSMGIIGAVLLVGPYVLIIALGIIHMLRKFKTNCTLERCSLILGMGLVSFLAYFSGNTLESLGISIILGVVYGYSLKNNFKPKEC